MTEESIQIGSVGSVSPARRELRIRVKPNCARFFEAMDWIRIVPRNGATTRCKVAAVASGPSGPIITLTPGVTRNNVGRMKGAAVMLTETERRSFADGGVLPADLMDMQVVDADHGPLGTVAGVHETPANTALVIACDDGRRLLLPMIEAVVREIDPTAARIVVAGIGPYVVEAESGQRAIARGRRPAADCGEEE